jgi:hypothetical protein
LHYRRCWRSTAPAGGKRNGPRRSALRRHLGLGRFDKAIESNLREALRAGALEGRCGDELLIQAKTILRGWRVMLPAINTLERIVTSVVATTTADLFTSIAARLPDTLRSSIDLLVEVPAGDARSSLFRLKDYPKSANASVIKGDIVRLGLMVQPEAARSGLRSPRFRRDPFVRDGVSDLGRAPAPRIAAPDVLPSTLRTVSASAASPFRGSIAYPTQLLCTLRHGRHLPRRNTRYQAGATPYLYRSSTGWIAPASPGAHVTENDDAKRPRTRRRSAAEQCRAPGALSCAPQARATFVIVRRRRPVDRRGRIQCWHDAVAELIDLQAGYAAWFDTLPESLRDTATARTHG